MLFDLGSSSAHEEKYPLFALKTPGFGKTGKPLAVVTGGVHGYETCSFSGFAEILVCFLREWRGSFSCNYHP